MTNKSKNSENQEFKVPPAFKFQEGEKVLCFHGPLIYEAKCNQARYDEEEKTNKYHIHYSGWNKSWDEWVPETRVLKYNDGNIQKQKDLHKAQKAEPKGKKGKKRSVTGKEKDGEGKEKEADDSRSSTPVNEKGGGKASASATQSSSQESASDIPKRKRSKLDPSVESSDEQKKITQEFKKSPVWKVALAGSKRPKKGGKSSGKIPERVKSPQKDDPPKKAKSPDKKPKSVKSLETYSKEARTPTSSPKRGTKSKSETSSPSVYPDMNGKKLRISISATDVKNCRDNGFVMTAKKVNSPKKELQKAKSPKNYLPKAQSPKKGDPDSSFGVYVAEQLSKISDPSKKALLKIKIKNILK